MSQHDDALTFSNPRLLAAIYYGLLSVVGTVLINAFLTTMGIAEIIPIFQGVLLGMVVASCTGALFGEKIILCKKPYKQKTFWLGFFMVIVSLPVFDLGVLFFMKNTAESLFSLTPFHHLISAYLIIVGYSYLLFGFLLAIACGFASMYLRGQLVYDILYTDEYRKRVEKRAQARRKKTTIQKTHITHHQS